MNTSKAMPARSWWAVLLAAMLLLPALAAQQAWASDEAPAAGSASELQAQAQPFAVEDAEGGVRLIYKGTDTSVSVPKTYDGKKVVEVDVAMKGIESLDVSKAKFLRCLNCDWNKLTELDVSQNKDLIQLSCYNNKLRKLDVSQNTKLEWLWCGDNKLRKLDVSQNTELHTLLCSRNKLVKLNVTKNVALMRLSCLRNELAKLNISKNADLIELDCRTNPLTASAQAKLKKWGSVKGHTLYI